MTHFSCDDEELRANDRVSDGSCNRMTCLCSDEVEHLAEVTQLGNAAINPATITSPYNILMSHNKKELVEMTVQKVSTCTL